MTESEKSISQNSLLALDEIFHHNGRMKHILLVFTILAAQSSFAQMVCSGWVGPKDESTAEKFDLVMDNDNEFQTSFSGETDNMSIVMLYFKEDGQAQTSMTDRKTKVTVGTHAGFDFSGDLNLGFSVIGVAGQPDRHAILKCHNPDLRSRTKKTSQSHRR